MTTASGRLLVQIVVLITFTLQSFLVQTHLHNLPWTHTAEAGVTVSAPAPQKAPIDADSCLLCQEFVHSGAYLTPDFIVLLPPGAAVSLLPLVLAPFAAKRPLSHNWMGRAPPHA